MSIFVGLDIGSISTECVILNENNGEILASSIFPTGARSTRVGEDILYDTLEKLGISYKDIDYVVATGYGRVSTKIAQKVITEISCFAKGAHWLFPTTRTIIDIGGQDCKVIRVDSNGKVIEFAMNDKCAAGTGRFLEVMALALELTLDQYSSLNLTGVKPSDITPECAVFAESEVISLLSWGTRVEDIVAGLNLAVARRIRGMMGRKDAEEDLVICGGGAKNLGVRNAISELLGKMLIVPEEPQIIGALGAALLAKELALSNNQGRKSTC